LPGVTTIRRRIAGTPGSAKSLTADRVHSAEPSAGGG
jgi:hypothetical protein